LIKIRVRAHTAWKVIPSDMLNISMPGVSVDIRRVWFRPVPPDQQCLGDFDHEDDVRRAFADDRRCGGRRNVVSGKVWPGMG